MKRVTTWKEFNAELNKDPEYREAKRKLQPYFNLSREIVRRRIVLKLSQKELANKAKVSLGTIAKIEEGKSNIKYSTLIAIAEALGCRITTKILVI